MTSFNQKIISIDSIHFHESYAKSQALRDWNYYLVRLIALSSLVCIRICWNWKLNFAFVAFEIHRFYPLLNNLIVNFPSSSSSVPIAFLACLSLKRFNKRFPCDCSFTPVIFQLATNICIWHCTHSQSLIHVACLVHHSHLILTNFAHCEQWHFHCHSYNKIEFSRLCILIPYPCPHSFCALMLCNDASVSVRVFPCGVREFGQAWLLARFVMQMRSMNCLCVFVCVLHANHLDLRCKKYISTFSRQNRIVSTIDTKI